PLRDRAVLRRVHPQGLRAGGRRRAGRRKLRLLVRQQRRLADPRAADGHARGDRCVTEGFLPYGRQTIQDDDVAAVAEALRADFLTTGPTVARFEQAFAETVGAAHAVAASNGTATLHLAMLALGVGAGDVCVVPSITFLATASCAAYVGAD